MPVTKEQIKREFDLFGRVWNVYKAYYEPSADSAYWDQLVEDIQGIMRDYPGQLGHDLAMAILSDIEKRYKEQR